MAGRAPNAGGDVDTVVEEGVIRQHMYADPGDGLVFRVTFPDESEFFAVRLYVLVAVHACGGGRYGSVGSFLHGTVAIPAIQP